MIRAGNADHGCGVQADVSASPPSPVLASGVGAAYLDGVNFKPVEFDGYEVTDAVECGRHSYLIHGAEPGIQTPSPFSPKRANLVEATLFLRACLMDNMR